MSRESHRPLFGARFAHSQGLRSFVALDNLVKTEVRVRMKQLKLWVALSLAASLASGCAVVAVADAAVTVVATGVKVGAKAVGAVADAVIPGGSGD